MLLKEHRRRRRYRGAARESATSLDRVLHFFKNTAGERNCDAKIIQRINMADKDIASLTDHMRFLSERIGFLLDATLGIISNEQNQIIKLFSVMAVMLMPPTLVASIYGMNFKHMPELEWTYGYPWALGLMVLVGHHSLRLLPPQGLALVAR